ncbi:MAG: hypothetical protein Q7T73_22445, partial [Beijerinckiaceae bacterium]|nr:hypothetical protein [Beijerinckiaceae bacterium]
GGLFFRCRRNNSPLLVLGSTRLGREASKPSAANPVLYVWGRRKVRAVPDNMVQDEATWGNAFRV